MVDVSVMRVGDPQVVEFESHRSLDGFDVTLQWNDMPFEAVWVGKRPQVNKQYSVEFDLDASFEIVPNPTKRKGIFPLEGGGYALCGWVETIVDDGHGLYICMAVDAAFLDLLTTKGAFEEGDYVERHTATIYAFDMNL